MKIVFFGTSNVALPVLEALNRHHQVLAVVTQPDAKVGRKQEIKESPVSILAKEMNLKILKPEKVNENQELITDLQNANADIFVVISYGKILPLEIINMPKYRTINIHFSALPKYRGPSPIQTALLNGEKQTGISIFLLEEKVDSGPMLAQQIVDIDADDNLITLSEKLARKSADFLLDVLVDWEAGKITPLPQDETAASYTEIIAKKDGKIDWQKTATEIYNQFRAFYPWPGIWTNWQGQVLKITDCLTVDFSLANAVGCGTVLENGKIVCGKQTILQINSLQLAGKKQTGIADFVNGYQDFIGSNLF